MSSSLSPPLVNFYMDVLENKATLNAKYRFKYVEATLMT